MWYPFYPKLLVAQGLSALARRLARPHVRGLRRYFAERARSICPDLAEPWLILAGLEYEAEKTDLAFEYLVAANARDPRSRVIALLMGQTLSAMGLVEEAGEWLRRAAFAAWEDENSAAADGREDSMFWQRLGLFLMEHDDSDEVPTEVWQCVLYSTLFAGWVGGKPRRGARPRK